MDPYACTACISFTVSLSLVHIFFFFFPPCLQRTQRGVPAHVGDGAGDAALAHAGGAGLVSGVQTLCRGRRGAKRLGCLGSGGEVQWLCGSFLL